MSIGKMCYNFTLRATQTSLFTQQMNPVCAKDILLASISFVPRPSANVSLPDSIFSVYICGCFLSLPKSGWRTHENAKTWKRNLIFTQILMNSNSHMKTQPHENTDHQLLYYTPPPSPPHHYSTFLSPTLPLTTHSRREESQSCNPGQMVI